MTRLLHCVISYNRYRYLQNTVDSLREFFPEGDVIVFDDGSDDPDAIGYLESLGAQGVVVARRPRRQPRAPHGGLYVLMSEALEYASSHGYELLNYVQDDMQFLWRDPDIIDKVLRIFDLHEDALQVQNLFTKRIVRYHLAETDRVELHPKSWSYHFRPYGVGDLGFLFLPRCREARFHFLDSEGKAGDYWRSRGYKMHALHAPTLAYVPWPQCYQPLRRVKKWPPGRPRKPVHRYYLKPLSVEAVAALVSRPLEQLPELESYTVPWGWHCVSPFWFTRMSSRADVASYFRLLMAFWRNGDYVIPRVVGTP